MIAGVDVGGANTKICTEDGAFIRVIHQPLWKKKSLEEVLSLIPEDSEVAVVMTGELSDVFGSKLEGIEWIVKEVKKKFPDAKFFGLDMKFHSSASPLLDASNWLASSLFISEIFPDVLFVDIGSTTTDIIPVVGGKIRAHLSDFERMKNQELLYFGVLRTPVSSLLPHFEHENRKIRIASEYFACVGDIYLLLGHLSEEDYICETPDGRGKSMQDVKRRISRMFCADPEELDESLIFELAEKVMGVQIDEIESSLRRLSSEHSLSDVFGCGIGEFLIREASERAELEYHSAQEIFGKDISTVFTAYSVANLMKKRSSQLM
ncbi:MAG: (((gamma-L-glutamylamino)ethyl phenoxymethyl)furan-2-yl)methanamine synthase [Archaeoglobi archaeon]|nr:(((gamma-L-glutamylamino)ethyl phenoxymethyl)furan-2-yl)methanamine synthase [Archaeoglobi archaeon]MDK2781197.1 (((gamma-L-glutamylamino)ethyl phenoxymethyl)furan-2-yl)methanamine synthase [Archaeoglobi archaeon]